MADYNTSTNMGLPIPTVSVASGPLWATLLDNCLTIVDQHTHAAGSGVLITPDAININADLPINGNNLILARTLRLSSQGAPLALSTDIGCLYEVGNDLYFNDGAGNQIRLTQSGSIVGTAGSISGLPSGTASAAYIGGSGTFVWQSSTNVAANMDFGSAVMRNTSPNSTFSLTLQAPNPLTGDYAITLPYLPGGSAKIVTMSLSGVMSAVTAVDESTLTNTVVSVSSSLLSVKDQGITQVKLAPRSTGGTVAAGGVAVNSIPSYSQTTGGFSVVPGSSITITTTGRPVMISLCSANLSAASSYVGVADTSGLAVPAQMELRFSRGGFGTIAQQTLVTQAFPGGNLGIVVPSSSFSTLDFVPAGTYTYSISTSLVSGTGLSIISTQIQAYEL